MKLKSALFSIVLSITFFHSVGRSDLFQYTGVVYREFDQFGALGPGVGIGTTVSGSFSYDATQAPDFFDPDPAFTYASWNLTGPQVGFSFQTNGFNATSDGNTQMAETLADPSAGSAFDLTASMSLSQVPNVSLPAGNSYTSLGSLFFYFEATSTTAVPPGQLMTEFNPLSQWDGEFAALGTFPKGSFSFFLNTPNGLGLVQADFQLTSVSAVPEPTSTTMLASSALVLLSQRGRRFLTRRNA